MQAAFLLHTDHRDFLTHLDEVEIMALLFFVSTSSSEETNPIYTTRSLCSPGDWSKGVDIERSTAKVYFSTV